MPTVSVPEVMAEWAYSEIIDSKSSSLYNEKMCANILAPLLAKRAASVPFSQVSLAERYELARGCYHVRPFILAYLIGVTQFDIVDIGRNELAGLLVPPNAAADLAGRFVPFQQYIGVLSNDPVDARYNSPLPANWRPPSTPLTMGLFYQHRVLIDGFHRAAMFWRVNPNGGLLKAYVPHDQPYAII